MAEGYRVFKITDGDLEVDLAIATKDIVSSPVYDGISQQRITPHSFDLNSQNLDDLLFVDRWSLVYGGVSTNQLSDRVRNLIELLRRAWKYHNESRYIDPVYITQKAFCEENQRYSLVYLSPDIDLQSQLFTQSIEIEHIIENFGVNIARGIWRSEIPGTTGSLIDLTASDGPADPTQVHIANHRDEFNLTHIYTKAGAAWGANHHGTTGWTLFPAVVAQFDAIWFGSTSGPFKHIVFPIGTAGNITTSDLQLFYSDGVGTTAQLTQGDDYTIFPLETFEECLERTGVFVINVKPPSDWIQDTWNAVNAWWIILSEQHAAPVWPVSPVSGTYVDYIQRTPHIEIPNDSLLGDTPPFSLLRHRHPAGGDEDVEFSNTSRIIVGAKSRGLTEFVSHHNAGGVGNPAAWAITNGTDAATVVDPESPGGSNCTVTYVDETLVNRLRFTGTNVLQDYVGVYRPFLRCQQTGGSAGDVSVMLRTYLHEIETYSTKFDTQTVALEGVDNGLEVVDLMPGGVLQIPFTEVEELDSFTGGELYFEIHASLETGSAGDLILYDLILIPVDEWAVELDDPISDSTNGNSALRGLNLLDFDGGVITNRTIKQLISGSAIYPMETWSRRGKRAYIEQEQQTRLYYLMMHYPSGEDWGDPPLIGSLGMHLTYEMYAHMLYYYMRGEE